jgi:hypothetical protein
VSPMRYELGFYILEYDTPHSSRSESLKSYKSKQAENDEKMGKEGKADF